MILILHGKNNIKWISETKPTINIYLYFKKHNDRILRTLIIFQTEN